MYLQVYENTNFLKSLDSFQLYPAELYFANDCQSWSIMIGTKFKMQQKLYHELQWIAMIYHG